MPKNVKQVVRDSWEANRKHLMRNTALVLIQGEEWASPLTQWGPLAVAPQNPPSLKILKTRTGQQSKLPPKCKDRPT